MACNCGPKPHGVAVAKTTLPGANGFETVYVSKPLLLELDGVHYTFPKPGAYFVAQEHAAVLLELDEVSDGIVSTVESDQAAETQG